MRKASLCTAAMPKIAFDDGCEQMRIFAHVLFYLHTSHISILSQFKQNFVIAIVKGKKLLQ
jgi:hypothetical protein